MIIELLMFPVIATMFIAIARLMMMLVVAILAVVFYTFWLTVTVTWWIVRLICIPFILIWRVLK